MNHKITIILSLILIVLAIFGISINLQSNQVKTINIEEMKETDLQKDYTIYKANENINKGTFFDLELFSEKKVKLKQSQIISGDYIIKEEELDLNSFIIVKDLEKGETLTKSMLGVKEKVYENDKVLRPKDGFLSFAFSIEPRQFYLINEIKPNDLVDLFFKYEVKNPKKNNSVIPKKRQDDEYSTNKDGANIVNLKTFLKSVRVLKYEPKVLSIQDINAKGKTITKNILASDQGDLYLELSKDDVKKIFILENVGNFIILPADKNKNNEKIAIESILTKDFIKEIRGKEGTKWKNV